MNWSEAPEWAKYAARDKSGSWYWYERKPVPRGDRIWSYRTKQIPNDLAPENAPEDWKDTLLIRPNEFIDWSKAPEWARYAAQDADGSWCWYEKKPQRRDGYWMSRGGDYDPIPDAGWKTSLVERPQEINWDEIPDHINWIAMDADGDWYGYRNEPTIRWDTSTCWIPDLEWNEECWWLDSIDLSVLNWRESLRQRPRQIPMGVVEETGEVELLIHGRVTGPPSQQTREINVTTVGDESASEDIPLREETLQRAMDAVLRDRNLDYGDPEDNFQDIAALWNAYSGLELTPRDVAVFNILQKIARQKTSPKVLDHWVDIAGYAATGAEVSQYE